MGPIAHDIICIGVVLVFSATAAMLQVAMLFERCGKDETEDETETAKLFGSNDESVRGNVDPKGCQADQLIWLMPVSHGISWELPSQASDAECGPPPLCAEHPLPPVLDCLQPLEIHARVL